MLVHICCSVDSHYFLSRLRELYPEERLRGFFYNPNIHPKSEHDLRLDDVKRSCKMLGIELFVGEYDTKNWFDGVVGLEDEPEKGKRCNKCFDIRLIVSAQQAKKLKEERFTTTLLSSPMKEQKILFAQGDQIAQEYGLDFIKVNVRANGGVQEQNLLAKKDNLYRQNYCGCKFALGQQRDKQGKMSLEMMSDILQTDSLGSIEERRAEFHKRDVLEQDNKPYLLVQRKYQVYRNLKCLLQKQNGENILSYALVNSQSKKKTIIGEVSWLQPKLDLDLSILKAYEDKKIQIGFSRKEDSMFVPLDFVNLVCKKNFLNFLDFRANPLSIDEEFFLRHLLCGYQSINPILIVDSKFLDSITIEIQSLFQEESIFRVTELYNKN